jgi:hypothetical protein
MALMIELHRDPGWLSWLTPPSNSELMRAAVPSASGVGGALALPPEQQALFLASHAWRHGPYTSLVHLIDLELARQQTDPLAIAALAHRWGLERVWTHLCAMIDWFIYERGAVPGPVHVWWARHLEAQRERSLLEFYLASWGRGLAAPGIAERVSTVARDVRFSFTTHSWQSRRQKLARIAQGARGLTRPASAHLHG